MYTIIRNAYSKKYVKTKADYFLFNTVSSMITVITLIMLAGSMALPSIFSLVLGIGFGLFTALAAILALAALSSGPMSYTTLIITFASIIPTISGKLFWNEDISTWQYFGIVLMFISIGLSSEKNKNQSKVSFQWLFLCLGAFILNGLIGIMQKVHQSSIYKGELNAFLVISFIVSVLISFAAYWVCVFKEKKSVQHPIHMNITVGAMAVLSGICIALANKINLYLAGAMDSAVFFPIVNGGGLVLAAIAAVVLFKERLSPKRRIGLIVGMISVLFICNVFNICL